MDGENLSGMKIILDIAMDQQQPAQKIFQNLGADVKVINNSKMV